MNPFRPVLKLSLGLLLITAFFATQAIAQQDFIYANSAGTRGIDVIDSDTDAIVRTCVHGKGNGRGIVVVGNLGYYTVSNAGTVWVLDIDTCEDLGIAFETGLPGIATIAYTGSTFWVNEYNSPGNGAFEYASDGTLLNSITLVHCGNNCDGVEFYEDKLISNRGDATPPVYDVYALDGTVLVEGFINDPQGGSTTGIAYDGTNFWVSDIFQNRLRLYDGTTGDFIEFLDITGGSTLIEDLSVDYAQRPDTGGELERVPTLGEWGLITLMLALIMLGGFALRRHSQRG